jgi:hypothetical protein
LIKPLTKRTFKNGKTSQTLKEEEKAREEETGNY